MAKRPIAAIVSVCRHCHQIIDVVTDESSENGRWEPPVVGGQVEADVITDVKEVKWRHSPLRGYIIELDTRVVPHCSAAKRAKASQ